MMILAFASLDVTNLNLVKNNKKALLMGSQQYEDYPFIQCFLPIIIGYYKLKRQLDYSIKLFYINYTYKFVELHFLQSNKIITLLISHKVACIIPLGTKKLNLFSERGYLCLLSIFYCYFLSFWFFLLS